MGKHVPVTTNDRYGALISTIAWGESSQSASHVRLSLGFRWISMEKRRQKHFFSQTTQDFYGKTMGHVWELLNQWEFQDPKVGWDVRTIFGFLKRPLKREGARVNAQLMQVSPDKSK